jgi:hypothetical protein
MKYPFEPKSTKNLAPGQFWGVPLRSGRFAAGVVLAHAIREGKRDTRLVCIGLLDWVGNAVPTSEDVVEASVLEHGFAHVRSIQRHGGAILGQVERNWPLEPEVSFDRLAGSGISVWGLSVIHYTAERLWGDEAWVKEELTGQWSRLLKSEAGT